MGWCRLPVPTSRGGAGHHVFAHWNLCRRARSDADVGPSTTPGAGDWRERQPRWRRRRSWFAPLANAACNAARLAKLLQEHGFAVMVGGGTVVANQRRASDVAGGFHWLAAEEPAPGNPDTSGSRERRLAELEPRRSLPQACRRTVGKPRWASCTTPRRWR